MSGPFKPGSGGGGGGGTAAQVSYDDVDELLEAVNVQDGLHNAASAIASHGTELTSISADISSLNGLNLRCGGLKVISVIFANSPFDLPSADTYTAQCDTTDGDIVLDVTTAGVDGQIRVIKKIVADNLVTVQGGPGLLIDGQQSVVLSNLNSCLTIQFFGDHWNILSGYLL